MAQADSESQNGPMERLKSEARSLVGALGNRAVESVRDRLEGTAGRLTEYVEGGGGPGLMAAVTGARNLAEGKSPARSMVGAGMAGLREKVSGLFGRGRKGGGARKLKLTSIVESIDVGVPIKVAYNQWTQYSDFPKFTKKVENVDQNQADEENKTNWKAQIFLSHRTWEATVIEQVPDERIIWRSKGQKGHVDGSVSFHELTPNLTRILLVMEYHPQGLFEHTGNIWRAQGRRARLEFKHFRRHMMMQGILQADELEGWRGTIHDGEVVESHEDAIAREEREEKERSEQAGSRQSGNGRVDDADESRAETSAEESEAAAGERGEAERGEAERGEAERGEAERDEAELDEAEFTETRRDAGEGRGEESGNGRAAPERTRASTRSQGRRTSGTRSSEGESGGNRRRQRAGAGTQRGGNT